MHISRREVLRQCVIITVGAALIPACVNEKNKPVLALKHLKINGDQQAIITEVSETIIPKTDTPGAKDTYTHLFVLKMLDDCAGKEDQDQFVKGLNEFDKFAKKKFDKPFVQCTPQQREQLIRVVSDDKQVSDDVSAFYKSMKKLTVQGYMTSQYYLTNVRIYKLVPGKFYGCLPVTSLNEKGPSI